MDASNESKTPKVGRWSKHEHMVFLLAVSEFGKNWKEVHKMLPGRSLTQIRSHAQKYFKQEKERARLGKAPQLYRALSDDEPLKKYLQFLYTLRACPHDIYFIYFQQAYKLLSDSLQAKNKRTRSEEPEQNSQRIRIE